MNNPNPLHLEEPLGINEARAASRTLAQQRRAVENEYEAAAERAAATEATYRKALAEAFVKGADDGGTAAQREAVARATVTTEAYERDLAAYMLKVWRERLTGLEGERSQLRALMDLSARTYGAAA